jgi:hypothetical protein
MFTRASVIAACAAIVTLSALSPLQAGSNGRHTTYVTFSRSVALPGVTLPAGTYVFERVSGVARTDIVQVLNGDRSRAFLLAFTDRTPRPVGWPATRHIALGEVPPGSIPPVLVWYPTGEELGHKFIYSAENR